MKILKLKSMTNFMILHFVTAPMKIYLYWFTGTATVDLVAVQMYLRIVEMVVTTLLLKIQFIIYVEIRLILMTIQQFATVLVIEKQLFTVPATILLVVIVCFNTNKNYFCSVNYFCFVLFLFIPLLSQ